MIESLNKYLTLILALFAFLTYWIKRHYDYKTKQDEIRFNLFYQNKIEAINDFFATYMEFETTFNSHYFRLLEKTKAGEFDKYFIPVRDKLYHSYSRIQLFENELDQEPYKRIIERNIILISETLRIAHNISDLINERNPIIQGNEIHAISSKTNSLDKKDLAIIANQTRKDFKISKK